MQNLKNLQDDKEMIESEPTTLKVGPIGDIQRGTFLFAEENKRQGKEAMTILKNKYAQAGLLKYPTSRLLSPKPVIYLSSLLPAIQFVCKYISS